MGNDIKQPEPVGQGGALCITISGDIIININAADLGDMARRLVESLRHGKILD